MRQLRPILHLALFTLLSVSWLGCAGSISGESPRSSDDPGVSTPPTGKPDPGRGSTAPGSDETGKPFMPSDKPPAAGAIVPGTMPLRRLTRVEYTNTIAELLRLQAASSPTFDLPLDPKGAHGFALASPVGEVDTTRLQDAADAVAALASKNVTTLVPCDPTKGEAECARKFIESFGRRAFRRALTPAEIADLVALYDNARGPLALDFAGAIGQLVQGIVQSPQFLYRWELGPKPAKATGGVVRLGPDEIAARLSFFLWSSMPDDALFTAVDSGKLTTAADVAREARRMLADPKSRATIQAFHRQWLHLKDEATTDLGRAMDAENAKFAQSVFEAGGGLLDQMLLSPTSFVNKPLADIYEVKGVTGTALVEQKLDETKRFGVFTQAGFLSATGEGSQSHPPRRGAAIFEQLLCGVLPPQPDSVPPVEALKTGQSNRERFEDVAKQPCASACHSIIHPLGFAFENYDGTGKYRTQDGGKPINASGTIELDGQPRSFTSARELMPVFAASPTVRACVATQWTRFALARAELSNEAAALAPALEAFKKSQYDLRELVIAITQTPSFLNRTPSAMEVIAQ